MPEVKKPRRGSLAFYPRKKAKRIYPKISTYPKIEEVKPLAFAGYKVGMTQIVVIDNNKNSPTFGQEIVVPVTAIECQPLRVVGIRAYKETKKGMKVFCEVWAEQLPKEISRKVKIGKVNQKEKIQKIEKNIENIKEIRLIVATQPKLTGLKKKTPEIFEIPVGGKTVKEKWEYAKSILGKEIDIKDVFREGEFLDVIAITKGKGTQGPVKRFGVKIQVRKAHGYLRHVGSLGQERPGKVRWTVAQAGQTGFQRRTEYNKKLIKIGEGKEINPKGGWIRYGVIRGKYVLIEGSVPGPKKRLIIMRKAIRAKKVFEPVEVKLIS